MPSPGAARTHILCISSLLLASYAALTGCTQRAATGSVPALAFPVPTGWTVVPAAGSGTDSSAAADQTTRLRDASGACRMQFSRTFTPLSLGQWQSELQASFAKSGHAAQSEPPMSLGGAPAAHLQIKYSGGVIEQVYAVRSGDNLLTLITVHAAHCKDDFQDTLDAFRA